MNNILPNVQPWCKMKAVPAGNRLWVQGQHLNKHRESTSNNYIFPRMIHTKPILVLALRNIYLKEKLREKYRTKIAVDK